MLAPNPRCLLRRYPLVLIVAPYPCRSLVGRYQCLRRYRLRTTLLENWAVFCAYFDMRCCCCASDEKPMLSGKMHISRARGISIARRRRASFGFEAAAGRRSLRSSSWLTMTPARNDNQSATRAAARKCRRHSETKAKLLQAEPLGDHGELSPWDDSSTQIHVPVLYSLSSLAS